MKEVDIISKVVGRDTSGKAAMYIPGAGAPSVNLDDYLLKKIWDSVFEVRTDGEGNTYLFEKLPFVTQHGITMYADGGELDLPSIYAGLPIDGSTLIRDDNGVLMINPDIDLGGGASTWDELIGKPTWIGNTKPSYTYSEILQTPDLSVYALAKDLEKYVTLNTEQTIAARKNFLNGLSVGGLSITKSQDDVIYLDANLVVRGGITMYAEGEVDIPSILDSLPIASTTAKGIASFDSSYFSVDSDGKVTLLAENVGLNETELFDYLSRNNYAKKSDIPSLSGYATETYVEDRLDDLINGAPAAYDTLKEIADVLEGNVDSIGDIITTLGTKADKAIKISAGTGLSGGGTLEADRTLSLATSGVTAGTYKSVTVDKYGRVTSGTNPTTLAGYGITDAYTKTKVDELLSLYVTLAGTQTITGEKNFTGGLKVNGSPIVYDATNKYWKLEGDLLVTGGVTMFASDSAFTPSTIMNGVVVDGVTIGKRDSDGALYFMGETGGGLTEVYWNDIKLKPTFASVATSGKYSDLSGKPTLLSSFIDDFVQYNYLPLSGGALTNTKYGAVLDIINNYVDSEGYHGTWIQFSHQNNIKASIGWYRGIASIANENTFARIGVLDDGTPQYWVDYTGHTRYTLLHSGNWSQFVTALDGGNYLPISGGTIKSPSGDALRLVTTGDSWAAIVYQSNNSSYAWSVGSNSENIFYFWNSFQQRSIAWFDIQGVLNIESAGGEAINLKSKSNNYCSIYYTSPLGRLWAVGSTDNSDFVFYSDYVYIDVMKISKTGDLWVNGGITMYSDIRKKTKLQDVELSLKQIADAPLIEHYYNSDAMRTTHVGSIAQYWAGMNDWFCKLDSEGFYTMEIQNAALASAISIARELVKYESKTDKEIRLLKDEVKRLKKEIKILKSV